MAPVLLFYSAFIYCGPIIESFVLDIEFGSGFMAFSIDRNRCHFSRRSRFFFLHRNRPLFLFLFFFFGSSNASEWNRNPTPSRQWNGLFLFCFFFRIVRRVCGRLLILTRLQLPRLAVRPISRQNGRTERFKSRVFNWSEFGRLGKRRAF